MKRIVSFVVAFVLLFGLSVPAFAAVQEPDAVPLYNYISVLTAGITINKTTGVATCDASASALSGDTVKITLRLQQYDSGWTTLKTWTASGYKGTSLTHYWAVPKGYTYRVMATTTVYDVNGNLVETGSISDSEYY